MVSMSDTERCASEDAGLLRGWIVRYAHNGPKRIIFASGGLELLQMVLEPDIEWCASEDAGLLRGWIVRSYIDWRGDRSIP